jgi:hypothetical protein
MLSPQVDLVEWLGFFGKLLPSLPESKVRTGIAELLAKTK